MKSHASMNRIYRLVWNAALSLWVAVAENAKGRSKGGSSRSSVLFGSAPGGGAEGGSEGAGFTLNTACRAALVLLTSLAVVTHEARAADAANASVTAGAGNVSTLGNTTTINQASQRLAIDWTSLSTRANEALVFSQPNASAIALNRIIGSSPSEFLGSLTANGQVFILNPNGVLFGAGSQVNVGGLVASTLNMSNADFMAGNNVFTNSGGSGSVVNQGTMTAANGGYLALLAPEVHNEGVMTASLGTALLAAGNKVTLNLDNGSLLGYSIDQGAINALAENKHLIQANGGQVLLSAKAMDSLTTATVNNTGVIEAKTLQNKSGRILLMGDMETGTVNVGGTLDASAPDGGDGGFVETSAAHVKVADSARVTTLASAGNTGKWLIDPNDFTISATGDMTAADVASALTSTNFEIATATMGTAGGNGDIHVNQAINRTDNNTFTLTAERDININTGANITKTNAGAAGMTMTAGRNILLNGNIGVGGPSTTLSVTANAAGDITGTGTLNLNGGALDMTAGGSIGGTDGLGQVFAGSLKMKATTGDVIVNSGVSWMASSFDLYAGTNIRGSNPGSAVEASMSAPGGSFTASAGNAGNGRIRVNTYGYAIGTLNLTTQGTGGGGQIDFISNAAVSNATITAAHDVNASTTGNFNVASLNLTGSYQSVSLAANGGTLSLPTINIADMTLTGSGANVALNGALTAANVTFNAIGNIALASDINTTGSQTYNGNLNITGPVTLAAGGDIGLGGLTGVGQSVTLNSSGTITNTGATNVGTFTLAGGTWRQMGSVPAFSATDFRISGGTFIRALGGDGLSAGTAYQLTDAYGLQGAGSAGMVDKSYTLANDIDASGTANWNSNAGFDPIGNASSHFTGRFDGLGHAVSSLTINRIGIAPIGLFGVASGAQISNVGVVGGSVSGGDIVGGLVGSADNVTIINSYATGSINGDNFVGGLVGSAGNSTISDSYATGNVTATADMVGGLVGDATNSTISYSHAGTGSVSGRNYVGGLVGRNSVMGGYSSVINRSFATGGVTGFDRVGGLVGSSVNNGGASNAITISDSYATGNVSGGDNNIGGLVGEANNSTISNSYATGNVSGGNNNIGGLVGYAYNSTISDSHAGTGSVSGLIRVGGLVGVNNASTITGSYATGDVSGNRSVGGLVGENSGGAITGSYATGDVSGTDYVGGLVGYNNFGSVISNSYATGNVNGLDQYVGGLAGYNNNGGAISNSYATGNASTGGLDADGLVGLNIGTVSNSFHSATANPGLPDALGSGKTDGELKQASTFVGWDIASTGGSTAVWRIYEGQSMPLLRSFLSGLTVADTVLTYNGVVQTGASTAAVGVLGAASSGRNAGTYNGYYSGQQGYDISGGTLTVTPANLVLTTTNVSKTYNGQLDAAGTFTATGGTQLLDTDTTTGGSFAFLDKNAGTGKTVTVGGATLNDGNGGGNYVLSYVDNTSSTINQANLTVTATGVTKTYDGTLGATGAGSVGTLAGAAAGEVVNAAGSQAFLDKNFSIGNKTVQASGVTIKDAGNADVTGNYNISYVDNTASTINQANLTVTATGVTKTYDGTTSATGTGTVGALAGAAAGEVVNVAGSQAFLDKNAGSGNKAVRASGLTIKDSGNADVTGNYNIAYVDNTTSTINQANLTVTATGVTKTYDGTTSATGTGTVGALAGAGAGESVNTAATQLFTDKNFGIGNKTVQASGLTIKDSGNADVTGNYNIAYVDNTTSTINKADLTVTANAVTKTYDGTLGASGTGTVAALAGAAAGEVVDVAGNQAFLDKNFGIGNKTVRAGGVTIKDSGNADVTGNYNVSYVDNTTSTINKANLSLSTTDVTKTYDGTTSAAGTVTVTAGTVFAGDNTTGGTFAFTNKNAGSGNKTVTTTGVTVGDGVNNANYNVSYADNTTSTINQANLTLSTSSVTKTYDGGLSAAGTVVVTAGTVFAGDGTTGGTFAFTDKNAGNGNKTVTAAGVTVGDGVNNANYNVTYADNTSSTINRANLTVTATGVIKTYDGTLSATGTGSVGALAGAGAGESVNTAATQVFTDKNFGVGNKTVQASGLTIKDSGNADVTGNYNVSYVDNTSSTINKASLTVTATGVTKTYDGTLNATGTGTVAALAGAGAGELVNAAGSQAFLDKNAGTGNKMVRASGVTIKDSGNADVSGNYNIAYVDNGTSTINQANLTVTATGVTKTYDGTLSATGTGSVGTLAGAGAGEVVNAAATQLFTDKNFGIGNKTVQASGLTIKDAGNADVTGNYNIAYVDNTASTINQASLTVTANAVTKTYDGTLNATGTGSVGALAGAGAGESVNTAATQLFTDKNFGIGNKTVQASGLTIKDSGNADVTGNYNIAYVDNTTSTINKANLTVTATGVTKTYDSTLNATGTGSVGALAGAGAGEVVNTAATQAFTDKNFGIGNKTVQASGLTIKDSGNADVTGNYNIAYVDNTSSTINKANLSLSTTDVTKTYDGGLSASGTVVGTAGTVFAGDNTTGGTFAFTDKNVGSGNKTVTTAGVTVGDGVNNANYNIAYVDNSTSTINQANLTLSTANVTKTYDGTLAASGTATVAAGTVFSGDGLSGGTFAFTDKNAGAGNKTVTAAGVTVGDGVNNANYNVSYVDNTTSTINRANLTVTATGVTKTYDSTTSATGTGSVGTLAGAGAGESVNAAATQAFTDKNFGVGNKTVQVSGLTIKDSGNADVTGNYNIAYVDNTTSTINKANLSLSTSDVTKTYDGGLSAAGAVVVTAGTVFAGDNATGGSFAFTDKNAGTGNKTVTTSGVTVGDGVNNANYNVSYANNTTSTINKADLAVTAAGVNKVYDGTTAATVGYADNRLGSDVLSVTGAASFADKNAGTGKAVGVNGIAIGGTDASNYNLLNTTATTTASITPKALTVTANNDSKNYDGTAYSGGNGVSYSGFVAGDTSADIGGTVGYGGSSQGAVAAGSYVITPGGLNSISGNYALGFANGALSIKTSDAGTVALGSEALVGAYDSALQAVAGLGGSSGGGVGGGGFGGSAAADALAAAAAEAGNTDEN